MLFVLFHFSHKGIILHIFISKYIFLKTTTYEQNYSNYYTDNHYFIN
jgi:hypothetical protein